MGQEAGSEEEDQWKIPVLVVLTQKHLLKKKKKKFPFDCGALMFKGLIIKPVRIVVKVDRCDSSSDVKNLIANDKTD